MSKIEELGKKVPNTVGSKIIKQAIEQAVAEKIGAKPSDADTNVVIKIGKGEIVPISLRGKINVRINDKGVASSGWDKSWFNLGIWQREWSESSADKVTNPVFDPVLIRKDLKAQAAIKKQLTPEELKIVDSLKVFQ